MRTRKDEERFNLERHEPYTLDGRLVTRCTQTHIYNRSWAICKASKTALEGMTKFPKGTFFKIVPSTKLNGRVYSKQDEDTRSQAQVAG